MFKELKLKIAARRVERKKARKTANKSNRAKRPATSFLGKVWNIICWPFRVIMNLLRRVWTWICSIDLIGLLNLTLLVAIIVLFSMLIIDITKCNKKQVIVVADSPVVAVTDNRPQVVTTNKKAPASIKSRPATLPLRRDAATRKMIDRPVMVVKSNQEARRASAPARELQGDIIVDRLPGSPVLSNGVHIRGNLYLQHMRKYTLPCGAVIHGNMFLRDVDMLQFCGDFTVTGNIYVSPRSSFGPIPRTARVGGQVIL